MTRSPAASADERRQQASFFERHFALLISLPAFLLVVAVTVLPIVVGLGYSLTDYDLNHPNRVKFVGLDNYFDLFQDHYLPQVLLITFVFVVGALILEVLTGLALALLLARSFRGVGIFRLLYTLPLLTAGVVVAVSWKYLLNESFGWVNYFLGVVGLPEPTWMSGNLTALPSVVLADAWTGVPLMAILLLAGLLAVDQALIDAAVVDGASARQVFRYVTLPAIAPVMTIGILFQTVNLFRRFEIIQIMTGGGPGLATMTLNYYVYQNGFTLSHMGYASALSFLLILSMLVVLFIFSRLTRLRI